MQARYGTVDRAYDLADTSGGAGHAHREPERPVRRRAQRVRSGHGQRRPCHRHGGHRQSHGRRGQRQGERRRGRRLDRPRRRRRHRCETASANLAGDKISGLRSRRHAGHRRAFIGRTNLSVVKTARRRDAQRRRRRASSWSAISPPATSWRWRAVPASMPARPCTLRTLSADPVGRRAGQLGPDQRHRQRGIPHGRRQRRVHPDHAGLPRPSTGTASAPTWSRRTARSFRCPDPVQQHADRRHGDREPRQARRQREDRLLPDPGRRRHLRQPAEQPVLRRSGHDEPGRSGQRSWRRRCAARRWDNSAPRRSSTRSRRSIRATPIRRCPASRPTAGSSSSASRISWSPRATTTSRMSCSGSGVNADNLLTSEDIETAMPGLRGSASSRQRRLDRGLPSQRPRKAVVVDV